MTTLSSVSSEERLGRERRSSGARSLHVVLIHQAFVGGDDPGGTRHYELGRRLTANGHRFTIVASDTNYLTGLKRGSKGLIKRENRDGIQIIRAYTFKSLHRSFARRVLSFLSFAFTSIPASLRIERPDVVIGTTPPIFQAVSAWLVAALWRKPFLLEVRDLWPAFAIDMGILTNPLLIKMSRRLERFLYARADHVLVNSPAYRDYLASLGVPSEKITLIANGVDPQMFDPEDTGDEIRRLYRLEDKFVVTYAGALGPANDIDTILRAAEKLQVSHPQVHILLVGDGKDRPRLHAQAIAKGLENVTFAGAQPKSRMPEFLAASDVCIAILRDIPMFRTTYPNKVFDYMAAGRPTVLAIDGVIRDVVERSGGGVFVQPGCEDSLARAIASLWEDRGRCKQMGGSARRYVVRHFHRDTQAEEFTSLLMRVASFNQ